MQLIDAIVLIVIGFCGWLFWQGRRQAEQAKRYAERYCQQHDLQFLDIAWSHGRAAKRGRQFGWLSFYSFAFSSDGESRYEGTITLLNLRLEEVMTPPYRLPTENTPL